jgi:YfiH family protein
MSNLAPIFSDDLRKIKTIRHGFFSRRGGVSLGVYAALNCGSGQSDDIASVQKNRELVAQFLTQKNSAEKLLLVHQIHSANIFVVDEKNISALQNGLRPEADALVTKLSDCPIGVLTADCGPVLFCDETAGVIAAAHSGWKGLLAGILQNTIAAMEKLGAKRENITAAIGPCIQQISYEVGAEVREKFLDIDAEYSKNFVASERAGYFQLDLSAAIYKRLLRLDVGQIDVIARDTYAEEDLFFSYRRSCHRQEPNYGCQVSALVLA